jgi:hypothetical protein
MPVVELTRNSKRASENGPPRGPEQAMLLVGVTIKDGRSSPPGLFFAAGGFTNSQRKYAKKNERGANGHYGSAEG